MTEVVEAKRALPLYIALDVDTLHEVDRLVQLLGDDATHYKVGLQLYSAMGRAAVDTLHAHGKRVFLDLKFHDIPNTVEQAVRQAAQLGVALCTVHALAGREALRRAVTAAHEGSANASGQGAATGILAVTLLTSVDEQTAHDIGLTADALSSHVVRLAALADQAGVHGVVCSAAELWAVKTACPQLRALVPGIRPEGAARNDQMRVATPVQAAQLGADYLVIGRPITAAPDPRAALAAIRSELRAFGYEAH